MSVTRGNGTSTSYGYDAVSRLQTLAQDLASTSHDVTTTFGHDPAGGIASATRSNDGYAYTGHANRNVTDTVNGLNQLTQTGSTSLSHDARGNISAIGSAGYGYTSENLLISGPGATLAYDPLMRLYQTTGSATTRFSYDGITVTVH